jgi:hypothetical protein
MGWIVDLSVLVLVLGMMYALASEGLWGAALMFLNALFAGLIAFNFYEPLADLLASNVSALSGFADTLVLLLLFSIALLIFRLATDSLGPTMVRFPTPLYHAGRWLFGFLGACVTTSILLLAFHTAPVHKKMFYGQYNYDRKPPFGLALDWNWLGFFQYETGYVFTRVGPGDPPATDPFGEFGTARAFDVRGSWLIDHQNARPYGEGFVPEGPGSGGTAGAPAEGGAAPAAAGGSPAPTADAGKPGPGIPGGTAGAAAGLAPTNP